VFSTLHTNDAAGAFTRLTDMGVEPFLIASAVAGVVAQRLVRRLCRNCRKPLLPGRGVSARGRVLPLERLAGHAIYGPAGCEKCVNTGFRGRSGIFELLQVTEAVESLVIGHGTMHAIKQKAIEEGMTTLRDDGWNKVLDGVTTIDDVIRDGRKRLGCGSRVGAENEGLQSA
jgi:type II secretory ATPase GspE/PulE/Tfp pilus assembly ATPase PilB-like protein